jgi:hypothetical protein
MSLISFEMPCSSSSAAPIGIVSFTGQYWMPHSVNDVLAVTASAANGSPVHSIVHDEDEEEDRRDDVRDRLAAREKLRVDTSTRTCWSSR